MNRRHFGLSVAAAVLLARQLREAVAQSAGQPPSADTNAAWRMRDPQNDYGMDWLGQHYEEHAYSGR